MDPQARDGVLELQKEICEVVDEMGEGDKELCELESKIAEGDGETMTLFNVKFDLLAKQRRLEHKLAQLRLELERRSAQSRLDLEQRSAQSRLELERLSAHMREKMSWQDWIYQPLPQPLCVFGTSITACTSEYVFLPGELKEWKNFFADVESHVLTFNSSERSTRDFISLPDGLVSNNASVRTKFGYVLQVLCRYEPCNQLHVSYEHTGSTPDFSGLPDEQLAKLYASKRIVVDLAVVSRQSEKVTLVVECKRPCSLRTSSEASVPELHQGLSTHNRLRQQLWTYMLSSRILYGIITTLDITYFVRRVPNTADSNDDIMEITPGITMSQSSLLGAMHYVVFLAANSSKQADYPWVPKRAPPEPEGSQGRPESEFSEASSGERFPSPPEDGGQDASTSKRRTRSQGSISKRQTRSQGLQDNEAANLHLAKTPLCSSGWSGNVVRGTIKGRHVALKLAQRNSPRADALLHEASVYRNLREFWGQYVPELVDCGTTAHGTVLYLATEFIEGCRIGCDTITDTVAQSARQGLSAIHSSGFLHGDLHAGNIIVINGRVRFIDFGFAKPITTSTRECMREVKQLEEIIHLALK